MFLFVCPGLGYGTVGVTQNSILFGQSAILSDIGLNMRKGILAAFNEVNQEGGIYGRQLKLISLDDSYEPEKTVENTRQLINKVFALIGGVGTPTSRAVLPMISETSIPYIGPFTGAEFLRDKKQKNVINIRASYMILSQNTEELLLLNPKKVNLHNLQFLYPSKRMNNKIIMAK
ncbi:MAG: ABC transporter substrate-binding protein [Bdellovibrionales bacterium]|nr:ABC transporter substrate-binding protein [Bdellovibrionales bacterium]